MTLPVRLFMFFGFFFLCIAGILAGLGLWVYRDAKARGLNAGMWTAIALLVPNLIGLILYFAFGRKQQKVDCHHCGMSANAGDRYCPNCAAPMPSTPLAPPPKTGKAPLVIALICFVALILGVCGLVFADIVTDGGIMNSSLEIGMVQNSIPGRWNMAFRYLDGEKNRTVEIRRGKPEAIKIDADIQSGKARLVILKDGQEESLSLNELSETYEWDISHYPDNCNITLRLVAEAAKGEIRIDWR